MMHCPMCRKLDEGGYTHCLDCGTPLANGPVPPVGESNEERERPPFVVIGSWIYPADAHVARMTLEDAGIACTLLDENFVYADWFNALAAGGIKLAVDREDAMRARDILGELMPGKPLAESESTAQNAFPSAHGGTADDSSALADTMCERPNSMTDADRIGTLLFQGFTVTAILALLAYGLMDFLSASPSSFAQRLRAVDKKRYSAFQEPQPQNAVPPKSSAVDT